MLNEKKRKYLRKTYFDIKNPASFSSIDKFYKTIKDTNKLNITKADVRKWLQGQESYTAHKGVHRKFKHPKVIAPYKNYMWEMDIAFFDKYGSENKGYKYILIVTDILSHYLWTFPLKKVNAESVEEALKELFQTNKPYIVRTDNGVEFKNNKVNKLLKEHGIKHIYSSGETKANYAERLIKTIKLKLQRYFSENQTHEWIDVLSDAAKSYNQTVHRSIGRSPETALTTDDSILWNAQYGPKRKTQTRIKKENKNANSYVPFKFKVNDKVKISRIKEPFSREYDEKWTNEVFTVTDKFMNQGIPMYKLKDYNNDHVTGNFFQKELQKVFFDDQTKFKIERVISKRKRKGLTEVLVKWWGWPKKFNSYISEAELVEYSKANK